MSDFYTGTVTSNYNLSNDDIPENTDILNIPTIISGDLEEKKLIQLDDDTTFEFKCKVEENNLKLILSEVSALAPFIYETKLTMDAIIKVNDIFKACDNLGKIKEHIDNLFNAKRIKLSSSKNKEIIYCEFRAFNISGEEQFKIPTERKMTNEKEQMLLKLYSIQKEKLKILKDIEKYLKGNKNINKMELENIMKGVKGQ
jgi:hypothetical protein